MLLFSVAFITSSPNRWIWNATGEQLEKIINKGGGGAEENKRETAWGEITRGEKMKRDERQECIGPKKEKLRRQQEEQKGKKRGLSFVYNALQQVLGFALGMI